MIRRFFCSDKAFYLTEGVIVVLIIVTAQL
jgi:hypothetical protein